MKKAETPQNEVGRLAALERYGILDSPSDSILDGIAQAAADLCEAPFATIALIDANRQWFKSCVGIPLKETPRDISFCSHTILDPDQVMEVEDTRLDDRFANNPLVTDGFKVRFYAGKSLVTADNYALGTLCVIDDKPRRLSRAQKDGLSRLAQVVIELMDERYNSTIAAIDSVVEQTTRHGVMITDASKPDHPITYANHAMQKMTGYSSEELIGKNCSILQGPETDAESVQNLHDAIAADEVCTVVLKNYRKDGTTFWNELTVSPVKDKRGNTINHVGVQHDVSDQQASEEKTIKLADVNAEVHSVVATRNRLAKIVEDSVDEIYVANADTYKILDVNRTGRDNLGYTYEESQNLSPWDFVVGMTKENLRELIAPLLDGTLDAQVFEAEHRRKDGTTYPVATHLQYMGSQIPPVFTALAQDISERRLQEETIRLRDNAIEALDVGVSITDTTQEDHPLVYVNRALCRLTGYSADELLGKSALVLQGVNQNQAAHIKIRQAQEKGEHIREILESTRKDGSFFMNEVSISPVHNADGDLTHYIGINRDVTENLQTEARLRQAQKIDAIGQLSGGIAHDFNNLLSVISGNLEFMSLGIADEVHRECLEEADKAAQMGARLTRRLLTFAKQGQLEPEVLDANKHVINATKLLRSTIGETINLTANLAVDLWRIHADASEIENTVVNLVLNARDAMPDGGDIKIDTSNVAVEEQDTDVDRQIPQGEYIRLAVTDNGSGMSDEVQARIFEPFFTTKVHGKGTGLGLASIHGFVNQSNGHVRVHSEIGFGTTIVLYLPKYSHESTDVEAVSVAQVPITTSPARILVVEDNDMVRNMTVKRLRVLGYTTDHASNGKEAIQFLQRDPNIDLVLSDIVMSGGTSGFDVARWVKSNLPQCHVVLCSGYNDPVEGAIGDQMAELTVLAKPYSLTQLQEAVSEKIVH